MSERVRLDDNRSREVRLEEYRDVKRLSRTTIQQDPPGSLLVLLREFFTRRGGNQPILERDGTTVTLKTENAVFCPSPMAQKQSGVSHKDVCNIHKRAFVEGMTRVFEAFIPGLQVQYVNLSSRSIDPRADCVETFHVLSPW
jgi:hypothetical protein